MENLAIQTTTQPIMLTEGASSELKKIIEEKNLESNLSLRVGITAGGCSGFSYLLGFDTKKENDLEFEVGGITILLDKAHSLYVAGMEIDYVDGLETRGFVFNNPNATSSCGCGSSFNA
ncbi:MAG: iron-sulfur cluster assembly accessory protein [Bacteroidetes bacterium]|nr:iron-sulfur cluster assembly accessory protein [Bacteroidota bacterium]